MDEMILPVFYFVDTFCNILEEETKCLPLEPKTRLKSMHKSEIMTICVLFHLSGYKCFKYFYKFVCKNMKLEFPKLVSYQRFVTISQEIKEDLYYLILIIPKFLNGNYIIDSTHIKVCHNKRIYSHSIFKNLAARGKSTMGWFFGFKLHIVINDRAEIMNFSFTKGNVDDRFVVANMVKNLKGKLFADRGYISEKLFKALWDSGLHLIHGIRKNMKPKIMTKHDSDKLNKRNLVESVFNVLKNVNQLQHTRHRSTKNGFINMLSSLAAYSLKKFFELNFFSKNAVNSNMIET